MRKLTISEESLPMVTKGRHLRELLRNRSFNAWCQLPHKGKGVALYAECPKFNSWMRTHKHLSSSEYISAIKMSCNVSAVRSVPGRSFNTTRCRQEGCNETETLGHVLGFCRKAELLRNNRHHKVRTSVSNVLRQKGWEVHEEIHCISEDDSTRRADIVAIDRKANIGMILDPTIRFERGAEQSQLTDAEKRAIYEPCIPYLSKKFNIKIEKWTVHGILFGARGSLSKSTYILLTSLGLIFF